uniref:Uncharacterized protein n=1 Tax=Timema cristinae TaxID=61476 RepID=A0A7R9CD76_TIMCR|nr:unnamed protein product [Timema cristinae]
MVEHNIAQSLPSVCRLVSYSILIPTPSSVPWDLSNQAGGGCVEPQQKPGQVLTGDWSGTKPTSSGHLAGSERVGDDKLSRNQHPVEQEAKGQVDEESADKSGGERRLTSLCGNLLRSKLVIVNTGPTYWTGLYNRQQHFQAMPGLGPSTQPPNHLYQRALGKEHGPSNSSTHNLSATVPPREGLVCPPHPRAKTKVGEEVGQHQTNGSESGKVTSPVSLGEQGPSLEKNGQRDGPVAGNITVPHAGG